ncbi:MAG: formyltransferase family protein [Microgenomates group bacterium]
MQISISISGSTERTLQCLKALHADQNFTIHSVITPAPKKIGRKQILTKNPIHSWAVENKIPTRLIESKVAELREKFLGEGSDTSSRPDYLLVVDFGYIVPDWLLEWPVRAPLNIHPSKLPRWRGSSPGQFVLLHGETESAVTLIEMNASLDQGPLVAQFAFSVERTWTQKEYYLHSFKLISEKLAETILAHASGAISGNPQPDDSPTPIAKRLEKTDSFIPFSLLEIAMDGDSDQAKILSKKSLFTELPPILLEAFTSTNQSLAQCIENAVRAFQPWPELWTTVTIGETQKKMKILSAKVLKKAKEPTENAQEILLLEDVCVEGKSPTNWKNVQKEIDEKRIK